VIENVVLTVGNSLMGDDGAGALLARLLHEAPLERWGIVNGGSVPENCLHQLRALAPNLVLVVDTADMDLPSGTVRLLAQESLENPFMFSTHTLPLTFLIESLKEFIPTVMFLGIQPEVVSFGYPMSEAVKRAVSEVYAGLKRGALDWEVL
jgi:hydrogenase 3 maturation protease